MLKFAFSTKSLKHLSLEDSIKEVAQAGFKAIELYGERPHAYPDNFSAKEVALLIKTMSDLKVSIVNIDAYGTYGAAQLNRYLSWLSDDWLEREQQIKYVLDCARIAAALGVRHVTISGGSPIPEAMDRSEAWRLFVANIFRVLSVAEKLGVELLLRPSPGYLIETSDHLLSFLKEMEFPANLKVDFDVAHILCADEDPCEAFEKLSPYVRNIHLSDVVCREVHSHVMVGDGQMNVKTFFECLHRCRYDDYIVLNVDTGESSTEHVLEATIEKLREYGVWD